MIWNYTQEEESFLKSKNKKYIISKSWNMLICAEINLLKEGWYFGALVLFKRCMGFARNDFNVWYAYKKEIQFFQLCPQHYAKSPFIPSFDYIMFVMFYYIMFVIDPVNLF